MRLLRRDSKLTFVSGRGGMGADISAQANAVSAKMAEKVGGQHVSLHVPEKMSENTYQNLMLEPSIKQIISLIQQSQLAIHSIGHALVMARERGMTPEELDILKSKEAIAEVCGTFYDISGNVVYQIPRIGLQTKMLMQIPRIYTVIGGSSKEQVLSAYMKSAPSQTWLLTDEGATNSVLKGLSL